MIIDRIDLTVKMEDLEEPQVHRDLLDLLSFDNRRLFQWKIPTEDSTMELLKIGWDKEMVRINQIVFKFFIEKCWCHNKYLGEIIYATANPKKLPSSSSLSRSGRAVGRRSRGLTPSSSASSGLEGPALRGAEPYVLDQDPRLAGLCINHGDFF